MNELDRKALESRLMGLSYEVIDEALRMLPSGDLLDLLDSRSTKIGETAVMLLANRDEATLLIDALLGNRIHKAIGRVMASNVLNWFGLALPEATAARLHLLKDRSNSVVRNALFGIVFARRRDLLPTLRRHLEHLPPGSPRFEDFSEAIRALEADDPSLFSPGFLDAANVWRLGEAAPPYTAKGKLEVDGREEISGG